MASSLTFFLKPDGVCSPVIVGLLIVMGIIVAVYALYRERKQVTREDTALGRASDNPTDAGGGYKASTPAVPAPNQPLKEETEHPLSDHVRCPCMRETVDAIAGDDLRDLVRDRLEEVSRRVEDWGMEVADALGELEDLKTEDADDARRVQDVCTELRRELSALGCEILDSDVWNPETQRAVKVEYTLPPGSTPSIAQKVSYGLRVQGRLVRKQEVCLQK